MDRIAEIQAALRGEGLDAWLFFDHHRRDPLAYRVLQFEPAQQVTRRWYYLVPAQGEPRGMVHKIEAGVLGLLPGKKNTYAGWQQQRESLANLLAGCKTVAMQYSPLCAVPYVSNLDGGTLELVRACGVEVRTSANLIQQFEAVWSREQYESHLEAGKLVDRIRAEAFRKTSEALRAGRTLTEYELQQFIVRRFGEENMVTDHDPIVAVNANASNPHYSPPAEGSSAVREGDLLLIDLWAKCDRPHAVYYDITWTGYGGAVIPGAVSRVFDVVAGARDAAVKLVEDATSRGADLAGFEVDDAARGFIRDRGYGEYFFHRTGHSIGEEVHGNGANMDNFETHDERRVVPGTCFSVEPGVYLPEFGIRSEVNVYRGESSAQVTGEVQTAVLALL